VNLSVANLRRVVPAAAAIALLLGPWSLSARAQTETPAPPAAADTVATQVATPTPAPATGKPEKAPKVKKAKTPKTPKTPQKSYAERRAEDGMYAAGTSWMSLRLGYAKRVGDLAGQGWMGYGMGWQYMMSKSTAFAASINHDIVGHFGKQTDIAVPFTAELQRHFGWKGAAHPYIGVGGGYYFRKAYRTQFDYDTQSSGGMHVSIGFQSPLGDRNAIGLEARAARVQRTPGVTNPTFGTTDDSETLWTVKGTWALVY
jgi:hypothetical protein